MCVYIYINTHISIYTTYIQLYMYSYMRIYIFKYVCFCLVNNRMVATKTLRSCPSKSECPFISKYMT